MKRSLTGNTASTSLFACADMLLSTDGLLAGDLPGTAAEISMAQNTAALAQDKGERMRSQDSIRKRDYFKPVWISTVANAWKGQRVRVLLIVAIVLAAGVRVSRADEPSQKDEPSPKAAPQPNDGQINVNWLYGSYVPKDVPLESMDRHRRFKLYIRQTYTTWGIYVKTVFFTTHDQISDTYPEWGDGFDGYIKRFGTRQVEFVIQNSTISLGDGLLGWEPRYDRCRCTGFWPRTGHALVRNFVTYDHTEKSLRPQLMPYLGAFAGSTTSTLWVPGNPKWQIKGYQAVITQVPVGMGIYWIGEFAPEIFGVLKKHKK